MIFSSRVQTPMKSYHDTCEMEDFLEAHSPCYRDQYKMVAKDVKQNDEEIHSFSQMGRYVTTDFAESKKQKQCARNSSEGFSEEVNTNVNIICEQMGSIDMTDVEQYYSASQKVYEGLPTTCPLFEKVYAKDTDGDTMLHSAVITLNPDFALYFVNIAPMHSLLNIKNHLSQTALHLAVLTGQSTVVRRLVVAGADILSRDRHGNTALHIACREGDIKTAQALLEPVRYLETKQNSYDIPYQKIPQNLEITNYDGLTCLHLAAFNGHIDIVRCLLDKQANINSREIKTGRTILHNACVDGILDFVKLLLKYKACDINARTYSDLTPFDLARDRGHANITFELAVAGAIYANEDDGEE